MGLVCCCESVLFDPPVRRCCACGQGCVCIKCTDCCFGINPRHEIPSYESVLKRFPGGNCKIIPLVTKSGIKFHVWCYEPKPLGKVCTLNIIYSHGRHEDITFEPITRFLYATSLHVGANVYLYEWPGFAHSEGSPSVESVYEAAEATYEYVSRTRDEEGGENLRRGPVMTMGHSMGCYFAMRLAVKYKGDGDCAIIGVCLRSPFTSIAGIKICPNSSCCCCCSTWAHQHWCCSCCDHMRNIDNVGKVKVPIFYIHSQADELINIQHTRLLMRNTQDYSFWELIREGHAQFPKDNKLFISKMNAFVKRCKSIQNIDVNDVSDVSLTINERDQMSFRNSDLVPPGSTTPRKEQDEASPLLPIARKNTTIIPHSGIE